MALNYNKERLRPVFICDQCGEEITDAWSALALYGETGTSTILHIHKRCNAAFCAEADARGESRLAWTTLSVFIAQLGYSGGLQKGVADRLREGTVWGRRGGSQRESAYEEENT